MADKWIASAIQRPGAFKAKAKAAGKSTGAFARSVLKEGSQASTRTKRQANLAQTLSKLRQGKAKFAAALVLASALAAHAATKPCPSGTLTPTAVSATGPTADWVVPRGSTAFLIQAVRTAGTATVALELSCDGTNWAPVQNGSVNVDGTTTSGAVSVTAPTCQYRANVTACAGCSVTVLYACAGS